MDEIVDGSKNIRNIEAEDLYRYELISDCQVSPDGAQIAFCATRVDRTSEKKFTNLWLVSISGGDVRRFTTGDQSDTHPRWSPDGTKIAFLSNRGDEKQKQIYIINLEGGEARKLSELKGEFASFEWSPDGKRLVLQFRKKDLEVIEREEDEGKKELGVVSRHVTRVFFRYDGIGYLPSERWHIWMINVENGEAEQLTDGHIYDELSPRWSPDGSQIAFLSNRSQDPDLDPDAVDIYLLSANGGNPQKVDTPFGFKTLHSFSPDGKWLAYLGQEGRGNWWQNVNVWIVPVDGSDGVRSAKNLTASHDFHAGNDTLGDIADRPSIAPVWSSDSQKIYFQLTRQGNTHLQSISIEGAESETIVGLPGVVGTWSADKETKVFGCAFSTPDDPGQIYAGQIGNKSFTRLTAFNQDLLGEIAYSEIEEVWTDGADDNRLQGWIIKPPDFDSSKKYPSILEIHGGPYLQYGNVYFHEFQFLAGQGYVVHLCNPRGGQGYGAEHSKAIHQNWGVADYADLMAWTDFMEKQPYIDPERMGVAGGSYGGYMTSWIVGRTNRFKAAVAQRVVSNTISFVGSSDVNWAFQDWWAGEKAPWDDVTQYWRQSPMAFVGNVKTPTLVIHSEKDLRCDPEQGIQFFVALKQLGVDTELILFPEESHGLSRGGRTDRRVARLKHMARWFDKYLKA